MKNKLFLKASSDSHSDSPSVRPPAGSQIHRHRRTSPPGTPRSQDRLEVARPGEEARREGMSPGCFFLAKQVFLASFSPNRRHGRKKRQKPSQQGKVNDEIPKKSPLPDPCSTRKCERGSARDTEDNAFSATLTDRTRFDGFINQVLTLPCCLFLLTQE